jgi:hypothetical protein
MKPILDDRRKQNKVLDIISKGFSRRLAARYVGCDERTIRNYANRHPEFAEKLRQSALKPAIDLTRTAINVAIKKQNTRLLIYFLDRLCPNEFSRRKTGHVTLRDMQTLMDQMGDEFCRIVPDETTQAKFFARLEQLAGDESI